MKRMELFDERLTPRVGDFFGFARETKASQRLRQPVRHHCIAAARDGELEPCERRLVIVVFVSIPREQSRLVRLGRGPRIIGE